MLEKDRTACPNCGSHKTESWSDLDENLKHIVKAKLGESRDAEGDLESLGYCHHCSAIFNVEHRPQNA